MNRQRMIAQSTNPGARRGGAQARAARNPVVRASGIVGRFLAWVLSGVLLLALVAGAGALVLTGRTLVLPAWVSARVEDRLNASLQQGAIELGPIEVFVDRGGVPRIGLLDVGLLNSDGTGVVALDRVQAAFDPVALLSGRIAPRRLTLSGAHITLRRRVDGGFALSFGQGAAAFPGLAGLLDGMERALEQEPYAGIESIGVSDLAVTLEDARSARTWQVNGGVMQLRQRPGSIDISVTAEVFNGTDDLAHAQVSLQSMRSSGRATFSASFSNAAAADIALQTPALAFLGVLDAPLSGALRATLGENGALEDLAGTLEIGAGAVQPRPGLAPLNFDSAKTYFSFRPATQKITFSQIAVNAPQIQAGISGHAYLRDLTPGGWPRALVGQFGLDGLRVSAPGVLEGDVAFGSGAADVRLRLDPFTLEIGQLVLSEAGSPGTPPRSYTARGRISADPGGWRASVDLSAPQVSPDRVLALWPLKVAAKTRAWLAGNVTGGALSDVNAAFRLRPGERPDLAATFAYSDAALRFLRDMPMIEGASGYAALTGTRFSLALDRGTITPAQGDVIDLAGSAMVVPDTRRKPAIGEFTLQTDSSLTALLTLLDNPPLNVLRDSPRGPDMAEARARMRADLTFELRKGLTLDDVTHEVAGTLEGVRSDTVVPGKVLTADSLAVTVTPAALVLSGDAALDGVPVSARWRLGLAPGERGRSQVRGQIAVTPDHMKRLGVALPAGLVTGRGSGDLTVDLVRGAPPRLSVTSDLAGLGLNLSALGWSKPPGARGALSLSATLGAAPVVERLEIEAAGLRARGRITLRPGGGGLERAAFERVQLDGWLDAPVTLSGQGPGAPPAIAVSGGMLDIRKAGFGKGGARGPTTLNLDRLVVTEGVALTQFAGKLAAGRATSGSFTARINGGTPVRGDLAGGARGVTLRLAADDAGGVLRDAGLAKTAFDGPMQVVLQPTGAPGTYDGTLEVGRIRIRGAPAIADLLGAISVVGLLEQLNGDGLVFDRTQANFRLSPAQLVLYQSSATGASLGISMDGVYDLRARRIDMQGVVSPIYLLNQIGSIFTRAGEGLFGFNFRLTGAAARPAVSVNPLSILTPGMFREIFRRPAPERSR